jgi:NAD(P)-dependent dehydrogenase (short-subunit alcohol dehydrogenase family)
MNSLKGQVVLVAGGSRGAGRGIALACAEAQATVYVAARTSRSGPKPADGAPGTVEDTAEEVCARGGQGIPVCANLADEEQVSALFRRIEQECGRLDVLANAAWGPNVMAEWSRPFWKLSPSLWPETLETIGVCWLTSVYAARLMTKGERTGDWGRCARFKDRRGLIVHVTDNYFIPDDVSSGGPHPDPSAWRGQILHDLGHECINRLIFGMSKYTKKCNVTVVGLNPGFMRTERVLMHMKTDAIKKQFRFDLSETPEYIGRAVVALASAENTIDKNGTLLWVCDLAQEYGFTDTDGRYIPRFDPKAPMQAFPC